MTTQQRNIREKLTTFKRIIYGMIFEIYQICSIIAKTKTKIQMLQLLKCRARAHTRIYIKLKNQKIQSLELIETIQKYI